jgi:hypothetical protein
MDNDISYNCKIIIIIIKYIMLYIYKGNLNYMSEYFYPMHGITFNFKSLF